MAASVKHLHVMKKAVSALFCVYQTQPTRGLLPEEYQWLLSKQLVLTV